MHFSLNKIINPVYLFMFCWMLGFPASVAKAQTKAEWNNTSFVHRSGQQIHDGQNHVIRLNGLNLGGWLMWEGWIWGGGFTAEKDMFNGIRELAGSDAAKNFRDSVYRNYICRADLKKISAFGFNVVRINFNHAILEDDSMPYVYKQSGWNMLDSILQWCEDYHVYAVIDLHSAPGGQAADFFCEDSDPISLWQSAENKNRTTQLWKAIAARYSNRGIIAGYDLLGEPNVDKPTDLLALYKAIIDSIRTVDNNHMIQLEGNDFSKDFSFFTELPDSNMCFHFHVYTWFYSDKIADNLAQYTRLSKKFHVPVWCGEWGENNISQLDSTLKILNLPQNNISGQAFWTWKKMERALQLPGQVNYPFLAGISNSSAWDKVSTWLNNRNAIRPSKQETETGIAEFIESIKLKNCTLNTTVLDMLKQKTNTRYPEPSPTVKFKFPSTLGISASALPDMKSVNEKHSYGLNTASLSITVPLFAKLHLGTLRKPIRYSGLFCSASAGMAGFQSSTNLSSSPLYSGFMGFTYVEGSTKNNSIAGIYAFENADRSRYLDAGPGILGLYLHSHQNRSGNTFIAGGGALVFNKNVFVLPVLGYIGKLSEKFSFLLILPAVAAINYKPDINNRFSFMLGPQGSFYKIKGNTISIADTLVSWNKINLQTGALKTGLAWSRKMNNRFEWYSEAGILNGNNISISRNKEILKEETLPSVYIQLGLTITLNPNRLENGLKESNERKRVDKDFNKQKTNPSIFNIERIFLD